MKAESISLKEAKTDKLFYFVANVLVYRKSDGRVLLLKRDMREKAHPGRWATPGGKMEWGDFDLANPTRVNGEVLDYLHSVEGLLKREAFEEAGIELEDDFHYINSLTFIRPDGIPSVLVKLTAPYKSGEIVLEKGGFTDFVWVNEIEVDTYETIDGIKEEVKKSIALFKKG